MLLGWRNLLPAFHECCDSTKISMLTTVGQPILASMARTMNRISISLHQLKVVPNNLIILNINDETLKITSS